MLAVSVIIDVAPGLAEEFLKYALVQAANSRKEEGCIRFDVFRSRENPNSIHFQEAYADDEVFARHVKTPYLAEYREKTAPMVINKDMRIWHSVDE